MAMLEPWSTPKTNCASQPPATMLTQVFWNEPALAPVVTQRDRVGRSARVTIYSYLEQGE